MDTTRFLKKIEEQCIAADVTEKAQLYLELVAEKKLTQFLEKAKAYKDLHATLSTVQPTQGTTPSPAELLAAIDDLRTESIKFNEGLGHLRMLIISRTPSMKEEDNAGVAIQTAVMEMIDGFSDAITGLGGGKKEGGGAMVPLSFKKDYFAARASAEEKIHKSTCTCGASCKCGTGGDAKDCGCNISKETVSSPFVMSQIDADAALKVSLGFSKLHQAATQVVLTFTHNAAKILVPRRTGHSMIG